MSYTLHNPSTPTLSRQPTAEAGHPPKESPAAADDARVDSGLRPWLTVAGCFFLTAATYGLLSAIGLLQTHLDEHVLPASSGTQVAFIVAMFGFLDLFCGQFYGVLFDLYGARWLLPLGSVIYVAAFVGLAFARTYAHVMACFVVAGVGGAMPTTVAFSVLSHWFERRVGLAMGIVTTGAGFGGILFSLVLRPLLRSRTWTMSILVMALIIGVFMVLGNMMVRSKTSGAAAFSWRVVTECFRNVKFWVILISIFSE
jgi:MFS family permease